ncbi:hypothetical protein DQ384_16090 [Sphaerisporangium album]|uniref:Histidine kinase/HSP90-like ATPase domain-containing protein n=1 Tax=Sphaerisporangium album TaxID=509200 RepID=A0A367FKA3_9ACTN|nr:hypothetical protein [Sphaerisporangium album]RCG30262.1 hypothetical protein DQ384_16090 [Sphaerisporangium album]
MNRDDAFEARPRGRHRPGTAPTQVRSRPWDLAQKAAAQQLDQMEPVWAICYGVGSRRFYAAATWPTPDPLLVEADTTDELRDLMRAAERAVLYRPPAHRSAARAADRAGRPPHPAPTGHSTSHGAPMPETQDGGLRTVCWDLPDDLSMVGKTRTMVKEVLTTWALLTIADDVILAVSELLANTVVHGLPPVRPSLWLTPGKQCVQVSDHGPERPRHLSLDLEAVHGP